MPPQPDTIQSMEVIVELTKTVCNAFGEDPDCPPPPQILHQSACRLAFECPPEFLGLLQWFECFASWMVRLANKEFFVIKGESYMGHVFCVNQKYAITKIMTAMTELMKTDTL